MTRITELNALKSATESLLECNLNNADNRKFLEDQIEEINVLIEQVEQGKSIEERFVICLEKFNTYVKGNH